MDKYIVTIADINILIKGNSVITKKIANELNAKKFNNELYDISLEEVSDNIKKNYRAIIYTAKGNMDFNRISYYMGYNEYIKYIVSNLFTPDDVITIKYLPKKSNFKALIKGLYQTSLIENNKNIVLSYSLFLYVLHIALLRKNKSFLHSGVFANSKNEATIFIGTSGCGKTSSTFKLLEDKEYNYLSDDYGIIDDSGYTYYNPKSISIYSSDIEFGQKILMKYFSNLKTKTKIKWYIQKNILKRNPMIKVSPKEVVGQRISEKSKIKNVLYFIRNNGKDIKVKDLSIEELCERASDASIRELKSLNEVILLIKANAPLEYNIPSFENISEKTKNIYRKAFKNTNNKIVYIPHNTKPEELVLFLKNEGLI